MINTVLHGQNSAGARAVGTQLETRQQRLFELASAVFNAGGHWLLGLVLSIRETRSHGCTVVPSTIPVPSTRVHLSWQEVQGWGTRAGTRRPVYQATYGRLLC